MRAGKHKCKVEVFDIDDNGDEVYAPFRVDGYYFPRSWNGPEELPDFTLDHELAVGVTDENHDRLLGCAIEQWFEGFDPDGDYDYGYDRDDLERYR